MWVLRWRVMCLHFCWICVHGQPFGPHFFYNTKFHFSSESKIWTEAKDACAQMQGSLFVPMQDQETQFVTEILRNTEVVWWTGVNDLEEESRYVDTSNVEMTHTDWFPGFPPDGYNAQPTVGDQTQDCVELRNTFYDSRIKGYSNAGRHYWNDATCSADKNFICKVKLSGFKGVPGVALSDDARSAYGCIIKRHEFSTTTEMVLKTVVGGTQVGCFMRCLSHVSCESANYDSSAHSCQLISVSAESLSELISAQESVYLSTDLC